MATKKKTGTEKTPTKAVQPAPDRQPVGSKNQFPIVGIGASAGGLEALEGFFHALPEDFGAAFVIVSHLDPNHASILPELIQKKTAMKVHQVADNMEVLPQHIYIIPPNKEMAILNGLLQLLELSKPRHSYLPIDIFFRSLAQDQGSNAIGIILSGTGTDGTIGIRAIKGEGGMVMAQDIQSARYDGMPANAIATGLVDYILPPDKMPAQLLKYTSHILKKQAGMNGDAGKSIAGALQKIFVLLRSATDHDFSQYKKNTICRRIERRMHVHQLDKISDYVRYLQESDQETAVLFKDLLIGVTSFFRDPESFELLKEKVQNLLKKKPDDASIRVWVPGCSSGEEAYSIAIILQEYMESINRRFAIQIFGTDLDEDAINQARAGIYPESIAADVSRERLQKCFSKDGNHYKVKKNIREMVVFALQNIIKDPPFTKLDMLCCRNLLIYFDQELQKKLLPIFHYSLKPGGLLFLGSSETIGQFTDLFEPLNKKWKIFTARPAGRPVQPVLDFPAESPMAAAVETLSPEPIPVPLRDINPLKLLKTIIAESDMSTCIVTDDSGNILYIHGRTGNYLEPAEGEANLNILNMARPGLRGSLTSAIRKMSTERQEMVVKEVRVQNNGGSCDLNLILKPLPDMRSGRRGLMLVIFEEVSQQEAAKSVKPTKVKRTAKGEEIKRLEDELHYTRENLQTTIEELETSNEELKSTNEELQSTNEELQSTNEELETSKEELQSLNEESATVNSELQGRIDELVTANDDMKNLLDATEIATIFLDRDLNIRRFTQKATGLIPLTATDIGRPVSHFASRLKDTDLAEHAQKVLQELGKREVEVEDNKGTVYRMRIRPYRTANNVIDGVVIVFEDITELKQLTQSKRLAAIVKDSHDAVLMTDLAGNILAWNRGAEKMYGYTETEALKMNIFDTVPPEKKKETRKLFARLQEEEKEEVKPFITQRIAKDGTIIHIWLTLTSLPDEKGRPEFLATTERDLRHLNQEALVQLTGE